MKSIILLLLLSIVLLSDDNYELKLYQSLLPALFQKKSLIVYTQESEQKDILKNSLILELSSSCSNSDLIIGKSFDELSTECLNKPIFATSYRSYINAQNSFGAFYWSKGRPQIQFKLEVIKTYNLHLPQNLYKYAK